MEKALAGTARVRMVSEQSLDMVSPLAGRLDARTEIAAGFPYKLEHASILAGLLVELIAGPEPMKGLITDLDDTLWAGLVGEVGVENIAWSDGGNGHLHGLYQQFLASLASAGVMIGVASKNDPELVEKALCRSDLLLSKGDLYPVAAGWGAKSEAVRKILEAWNVGPQSVMFVDDSPMEVAEVAQAFPEMACVQFPGRDPQAMLEFLVRLRDRFGRTELRGEDLLRLASVRSAEAFHQGLAGATSAPEDFLRAAGGTIRFEFGRVDTRGRAFELLNKTNQFNLNGERMSERAWRAYLEDRAAFLLTASYRDKFGDLGEIGALLGRRNGQGVRVDAWVLSCRAFSRRIEDETLRRLFEHFEASEITFEFGATPRNGPIGDFLARISGRPPVRGLRVSRAEFTERAPGAVHAIEEHADG
ncbi:MAG: HAD-IIIC family phosphatase [Caulobacteraceae bacterium]